MLLILEVVCVPCVRRERLCRSQMRSSVFNVRTASMPLEREVPSVKIALPENTHCIVDKMPVSRMGLTSLIAAIGPSHAL